jgi:hypothetical protein
MSSKTKKWIIIDIEGLVMILIGLTIAWIITPMNSSLLGQWIFKTEGEPTRNIQFGIHHDTMIVPFIPFAE